MIFFCIKKITWRNGENDELHLTKKDVRVFIFLFLVMSTERAWIHFLEDCFKQKCVMKIYFTTENGC